MVPAVKVDGVRMAALIEKANSDTISFARADRGPRHLTVVCPGWKPHAGRDLDLTIDRIDFGLAERGAAGLCGFAVGLGAFIRRQVIEIPATQVTHGSTPTGVALPTVPERCAAACDECGSRDGAA